jgi:uncharacterized protein (DUF58 family)
VTLLAPDLMARLESLQLGTRRRLAGVTAGEHRSSRRGTSLDFADYRQYHPGDDFRRIDYHLYARLDVLLLKLYEAEEDLQLRLLVDTSASMGASRRPTADPGRRGRRHHGEMPPPRPTTPAPGDSADAPTKLRQASRVAAALGFVALVRRDPVSVHTFPLDRPGPRFSGRGAVPALLRHLEALQPSGTTNFAAAVAHLLARPGPPGLTVVLSDLLTPEWEGALSRLPARGGDVVIIHVLAAADLAPPASGDIELVDRETGARVAVSVTAETAARYQDGVARWRARVQQRCHQVGAAYVAVTAEEALEPLLLTAWRRGGVLR